MGISLRGSKFFETPANHTSFGNNHHKIQGRAPGPAGAQVPADLQTLSELL
jgi:hypothetical protein